MTTPAWRLYYTDDRDYNSATHDWRDVPDDGVLVLRLYYDEFAGRENNVRYTKTLAGDDYYFHVPGTELFGCNNDPIDEIHERYPGAVVKRGKWTTKREFDAVYDRAKAAPIPGNS